MLTIAHSAPCVLILEDSVLVAMAIEASLVDHGFDAIIAGTLAAANERLGNTLPAAALLDLHLPDGTSIALARSLHERGCPVAICSGTNAPPADCDFATSFRKPVVAAELVAWIDQVTRRDNA